MTFSPALVETSAELDVSGAEPSRPRILLVDDQPARLLSYEAVLAGIDVECVRALSGMEALQQLLSREFAAILLDVNMPVMDGFETARRIREHPRTERTPIIFVTGVHISELDQLKGYEAGAIDYISIPLVPEILRSKVSVLVELYQRRRHLQALNTSLKQARTELENQHTKALADRDALLHAMFEHPTEPIAVLEAVRDVNGAIVDWRYRNVNTLTQELLGFTRAELLGRRVTEILQPDRAQAVIDRCTQVLEARKPMRYEAQFRGTDLLITLFPLGGECVISSAADITDHKRTEAALRRSEARHRALLENAPVGVAHNALDGRFEYVNRAFCKLLGYTAEELYAKRWQDITHPEDVPKDQALANDVLVGKLSDYSIEKRYVRKDGAIVWVNLFGNFVTDENGRPIQGVAVAIDITEQRITATALKDSREQLILAKAAARLGVHDWDIRNNVISWDERTREIWGVAADELITYETFIAGVHPDDVARTQAAVEQAFNRAGNGHYLATYRVINSVHQATFWVEATGRVYFEDDRPVRLVGTVQDVTEKTRAQESLRDSEARFRELANNIDQFAWTFDPSGTATWYNERWHEYTGIAADEMERQTWTNALHPEHSERVVGHLERCLDSGCAWEDTFQLRSKTGEYRWFLSRAVPIRSPSGEILRWFGTHTDITDLRKLQDALKQASERKDEFLAMLSHELRNPAAAISNATAALGLLLKAHNQEHALVGIIERQVRQMGRLLDDLLDVTRITQGRVEIEPELVTLQTCVELALETAQPYIHRKKHRLTTTQWYEPLWATVDKIRLAQCITNLLTNAAKYTPAGGEIRLSMFADEACVGIEVQDTGRGISAELLPHIFDWFVQGDRSLDRSEGGLGIGLALCRQLVEMQGGMITGFSGGLGLGATFTIRLPRAAAPSPTAEPLAVVENRKFRILIVDDNRDAAESLNLLLRLEGHTTQVVYSGGDALSHALSFDPQFVFLDIGLPEMDGYEVARRLKTIVPQAHVVAVTGYGLDDDRLKSARHGFEAHLVKPVSMDAIEETFVLIVPEAR